MNKAKTFSMPGLGGTPSFVPKKGKKGFPGATSKKDYGSTVSSKSFPLLKSYGRK